MTTRHYDWSVLDARNRAALLREVADELDPPVQPDPEPVLIKVKLLKDGVPFEQRLIPVPNIGDGLWGAFTHAGELVHNDEGTPLRNVTWQLTVERISG